MSSKSRQSIRPHHPSPSIPLPVEGRGKRVVDAALVATRVTTRRIRIVRALFLACLALAFSHATAAERASAYASKKPAKAKKSDASELLFATNAPLRTFKVDISTNEFAALQKDVRAYVRCTVTVGDEVFRNVGVHLKGNGSFRPLHEKPSLVLRFDRFVPGQKFLGLTKLALNSSSQDGTFLADYMANSLFRDANVPVSRVTHARVTLNGRELGLYVLVESQNKEFLRRHFGNSDGSLYEAYLADVDSQMDQDHGDDTTQSDRKRLAEAVKIPDPSERWAKLHDVLDVDRYVSHLVCELFTSHTDGYAMNRNNYRIYHNPHTGRFTFIGHGVDWAFANTGVGVLRPPLNALVTKAVLTTREGSQLYKERLGTLFTNAFRLEVLTNRVHTMVGRLVAHAQNTNEVNDFRRYGAEMNARLVARWQNITNQLYGPPPVTLAFDQDGVARLSGWRQKTDEKSKPAAHAQAVEGSRRVMHITATNGPTIASWRTKVALEPGQYVFEGQLRAQGVTTFTNETGLGAGLRISGEKRTNEFAGDLPWTPVRYEFAVEGMERDVELVCELRAITGQVWFDQEALRLKRVRATPR
jgi:spore coat protein H